MNGEIPIWARLVIEGTAVAVGLWLALSVVPDIPNVIRTIKQQKGR